MCRKSKQGCFECGSNHPLDVFHTCDICDHQFCDDCHLTQFVKVMDYPELVCPDCVEHVEAENADWQYEVEARERYYNSIRG